MLRPGGGKAERARSDAQAAENATREAVMQRVRVGITGLAAVFLLTILAAAMLSFLGQDDRATVRLANGAVISTNGQGEEAPREPLAELGVAPGNAPAANGAEPAAPPPATAPARRPAASQRPAPTPIAHPVAPAPASTLPAAPRI